MTRAAPMLLLVALSAVLLFWRLDGALLWRDEATTANWARLMAESGVWVPRIFDGSQLIVQASDGHDFNSQLLPGMQSWLQFYVAALSFQLLGVSETTARLPFALLGALSLFVIYRIGVALFGAWRLALVLPFLAVVNIFFLSAARQSRYYILVVLASSLLFLELIRYLRKPERAADGSFYLRLSAYGLLMYFSNYLSFAGMWAAIGIFILIRRDWVFLRGFALASAVLIVVLGAEFWFIHLDFAALSPTAQGPDWNAYRNTLINNVRILWRAVPAALLLPAAFYLFRHRRSEESRVLQGAMLVSLLVIWSPVLFAFGYTDVREWSGIAFFGFVLLSLIPPAIPILCRRKLTEKSVWVETALLAALVIAVSSAFSIIIGQTNINPRHYYQYLPAAVILGGLAVAALNQTMKRTTVSGLLLVLLLIWPNLDFYVGAFDQVVERQFLRNRSYNGPIVEFLQSHVRPGERVAFFRNVNGMMAYFYVPEMRWVELLESGVPWNESFRDVLPEDQFDDYRGTDWYVIWDPGDEKPTGLTNEYEKVWQHSYNIPRSFWDRHLGSATRTFEVYKKSLNHQGH